ncbi:unnamed protein product [Prunus armeniaca]
MGSSSETGGGAWSMTEDISLCEAWLQVSHCPVTGNEIKFCHMWKKIHHEFCERVIGSTRTDQALSSRWKILNKELGKWRDALTKAMNNQRSGENLSKPRPIGRKAAKAKRGSNSTKNTSKYLEELSRMQAMRIEMDMKQQEHDRAMEVEYAKEREYVRQGKIEKNDRETMAMDTTHMSPETKQFWKLERRDVMRRRLFRDDGPSNTDWLNDQNH